MIEQLSPDGVDLLLQTQTFGRLGCFDGAYPYIVPVTYAYDDGYIYGFTNRGKKLDLLRSSSNVCFEVDNVRNYANWQSVMVLGVYEELVAEEAAKALDILLNRVSAIASDLGNPDHEDVHDLLHHIRVGVTKGVAYRIKIVEKSGRYEHVPVQHRGAANSEELHC